MRTRHEHPSDRLSNGLVADFGEALELVDAQFAVERAVAVRGVEDRAALAEMEQGHAQISAATRQARRAWREEQEAARRRTIARLRVAADDLQGAADAVTDEVEWLGLLADALDSGDYAGLAI